MLGHHVTLSQHPIFFRYLFLSGATSLVYQVAWVRKLSLFFGSDVYSAAITLSAFMAGLGIGSWIAGALGQRLKRPLLAYGLLEIAIAVYAVVFATLLGAFDPTLSDIYRNFYLSDAWIYQASRAAIAFCVLLPPTVLMGATLPLVVQHFANSDQVLGARIGHFYAINTVGALAGTLVGGFLSLPILGVATSVAVSAAVNLVIGLAALWLALRVGEVFVTESPSTGAKRSAQAKRHLVLLAMGISGFAALALEVVWMRILVQSFSATVYAFSIMLACFLAGIFFGSEREARRVDSRPRPAEQLLRLELLLFAYVAVLASLTYIVPGFFGILLWGITVLSGGAFGVASIVAQAIVASLLIFLPTYWLGAAFPLAAKVFVSEIHARAKDTGRIYAANTFGALLGALAAGFVLIPLLGARSSLLVIAGLFMIAALVLQPLSERPAETQDRPLQFAAALVGAIGIVVALLLPPQTLVNFNMQQSSRPDVIYHGEGVAHTVDIVRTPTGNTLMMVNGNIEADTTLVQRRHFILKAHLPLLLHREAKEVAVVGLGLGITLSATARNPVTERIRLVELSPEMTEAHRYLRDLTDNVLFNSKINLLIDDGRNFLNRSQETFDMITADPIHPRITGVGYLYTREYYEAVRSRLRPGGYILHWMPMYAISRQSFDVAFRTFASVFPNASFWYVRGHGLFVAGLEPLTIDYPTLVKRFNDPGVKRDFESIGIGSPSELLSHLLMDSRQIAAYLASAASVGTGVNTDDNSHLEYATPFEFLQRTKTIVEALKPFAGWDRARVSGIQKEELVEVDRLFAKRLESLTVELDQPVE